MQRNLYFDTLRGIAILMVVAIHTFIPCEFDNYQSICSISMREFFNVAVPLFLAISGFFIGRKNFDNIFPMLIGKKYGKEAWLFSDACKRYIVENYDIDLSSIWIVPATSKDKRSLASKVYLYVNNKIHLYTDLLKGDKNSFVPEQLPFSYIYIPKDKDISEILDGIKREVQNYFFG